MIKKNIDQFNQKRKKTFAWQKFIIQSYRKKKWQAEIYVLKKVRDKGLNLYFIKNSLRETLNINRKIGKDMQR